MTAAERWIDEHTDVVDDDGDTVHAAVTVDLNVDSIVTVRWIHASDERPQGLALDADQPLMVGDMTNTRMVLWNHSAPDEVEIVARAGRLTLWNVWRPTAPCMHGSAPRHAPRRSRRGHHPPSGIRRLWRPHHRPRGRDSHPRNLSPSGDPRLASCEQPDLRIDGVSERSNGASFDKGHRS